MKATTLIIPLYLTLSAFSLVLLVVSDMADDTIDVCIGMGGVILGVLGLEAQAIQKSIKESREVR